MSAEVVDALNAAARAGFFSAMAVPAGGYWRIEDIALQMAQRLLVEGLPRGLTCDFWPTGLSPDKPQFELRFYVRPGS